MTTSPIPSRVHLVGIGGMHMSAIGRILLSWGHQVSGSDLRRSTLTDALAALGAEVKIGPHDAANVGDAGLVVTTSAATTDNPELNEARRRGIPVIKRADMVARLMEGKMSVAIAGCHGKSTTSGLVAYILKETGHDPTYLIGAEVAALGNNAAPGGGPHVVVEADEYDRAFLSYHPLVALVTNVEADHLDYYKTWEAVKEAFQGFVANVRPLPPLPGGGWAPVPILLLCADNAEAIALRPYAQPGVYVETYALDTDADWRAANVTTDGLRQSFDVTLRGEPLGRFTIALPIRHNVQNALGAIAVCNALALSPDEIRDALGRYTGVRRRFETVGEANGVLVIDDYAHHPTEIADTAAAAKTHFPGRRIVALFQPHTYARTRYLLDGFRTCFRDFDRLFLLETYAAREAIADGMTAAQLAVEVHDPEPTYCETFEEAAEVVAADLRPGDVFFTIGAGDVDSVGPLVLERLGSLTNPLALEGEG
jgi:UDP-N-acetylmuramate--alanine ligase